MKEVIQPTQQRLREYLENRHESGTPPPTPEEVRRALGWGLIPENGSKAGGSDTTR